MKFELPKNACCKDCGRPLAHMDLPFCPQCRRPFDPLDPATYDVPERPARRPRRRYEWMLDAALLLLAAAMVYLLCRTCVS